MDAVSLKHLKRQMVILDILPFAYNLLVFISFGLNYFYEAVPVLGYISGFSLIACVDLYFRSIDNNYCSWHRAPIFNMFMITLFSIMDELCIFFKIDLCADIKYPILYIMCGIWIAIFLISSILFLRHRLLKLRKRCTSCP